MKNLGVQRAGAAFRVLGVLALAALLSAHVGSPDVFFAGKAGPYDLRVVVRPPEVVPGVARVTVRLPQSFTGSVSIRPVYWRVGSKGSPSADPAAAVGRGQYEGSLWLMARGAYSVEVSAVDASGTHTVSVPVASVATGRLGMGRGFGLFLMALGAFLVVGLVNIVRKASGESLVEPGHVMGAAAARTSRIAGAVSLAIIALALFGGMNWWGAVDRNYERTMYRPGPLAVTLNGGTLHVAATDTLLMPQGTPAGYVPDHGKLMHLFLVKAGDAKAFAHLHPRPDNSEVPAFTGPLPPLPAGSYLVYADVVHETGFERTLVGSVTLPDRTPAPAAKLDPDDAWFVGNASVNAPARLADGSIMTLTYNGPAPHPIPSAQSLRVSVTDAADRPVALEPYLGMPAHAVVTRLDGAVYVHLHTMGTVTAGAQEVFAMRDRGDTSAAGKLQISGHAGHAAPTRAVESMAIEFPYSFPTGGEYRVFVQVKRNGRVLTGAFALTVKDRNDDLPVGSKMLAFPDSVSAPRP